MTWTCDGTTLLQDVSTECLIVAFSSKQDMESIYGYKKGVIVQVVETLSWEGRC